jgi:hypothetical protein
MAATPTPKKSLDAVGVPAIANNFQFASKETKCPKVVMLSSAGVTRPAWDDEKKAMFPGSAEIPIVRLNPFGILGIKAESEEKLRQSGARTFCLEYTCWIEIVPPYHELHVFSF